MENPRFAASESPILGNDIHDRKYYGMLYYGQGTDEATASGLSRFYTETSPIS